MLRAHGRCCGAARACAVVAVRALAVRPPLASLLRARRSRARSPPTLPLRASARSSSSAVEAPPARTVLGAAALVAGTTVGAGILALPAETSAAGFGAAAPALVLAWAYSAATGLLLAEVSLSAAADDAAAADGGANDAVPSLLSLAKRTLGGAGGAAAGGAYLFLHYALLVAYIDKGAEVLSRAAGGAVSPAAAAAAFVAVLGSVCAAASADALDAANGALLAALLLAFGALLAEATPGVQADALAQADWSALPPALPVIALAFVHHNVVPRVVASCNGHVPSIRAAVAGGTGLPLLMFIAWEAAVLGQGGAGAAGSGSDPLAFLAAPAVVDAFSLLAVATSFIGFVLGLSDFFADALSGAPRGVRRVAPLAATLLPPLAAAVTYPDAFFGALEVAGVYGVATLFGVLPGAMALAERARSRQLPRGSSSSKAGAPPQLVPGGDATPALVAALAAALITADATGLLTRHG
jgi:tyrosine-specific transport protein